VDGAAAVLEIVADAQVRDARAVIDLAIADFVLEVSRAIAESRKPYGQDGNEFMRRYNALSAAKLALRWRQAQADRPGSGIRGSWAGAPRVGARRDRPP
jgi:hypothetical protein